MTDDFFDEVTETHFNLWRHNPVTAAFLHYLGDQADNFRDVAMVLWEDGRLDATNPHEALNANVLRGRTLALRELQRITVGDIREFYRQKREDRQDQSRYEESPPEGLPG